MTVIGIAGSVGKTTTKELLKHLLTDLSPVATPAHVNTEMGVAQWLTNQLKIKNQKLQILIVEMGAYRTGEIKLLCQIAQPTIGVLTRLGSDHLALFGSEQAIRDANAELLEALPANGHAHILVSDAEDLKLTKRAACTSITIGTIDGARLTPQSIHDKADGVHFTLEGHALHVPIHGAHNALNAALAISVARQLGIGWERIAELLKTFHPVAHTFAVREENNVVLLDDTYNISPLSLRAAIEWSAKRTERPRALLTSGLLETGTEEDRFYRELGALAKHAIERVIFLSPSGTAAFGEAWGGQVELLGKETARVEPGSVLLAVGRMPLSTIQQILPSPVSLVSSDS